MNDFENDLDKKLCLAEFDNITEKNAIVNFTPTNFSSGFQIISIEDQNVQFFPRGIERIFPDLQTIKISSSNLKEIHESDLKVFPKLEEVSVALNPIRYLEKNLFKSNPDLKKIKFEKCPISFLPENLFDGNPKLVEISFDSNEIFYIHPNIFDNLRELKDLNLGNNFCIDRGESENGIQRFIMELKETCSNTSRLNDIKISLEEEILQLKFALGYSTEILPVCATKNEEKSFYIFTIAFLVFLILIIAAFELISIYKKFKRSDYQKR